MPYQDVPQTTGPTPPAALPAPPQVQVTPGPVQVPAALRPTQIRDSLAQQGLNVAAYTSDQELLDDLGDSIRGIQQLQQYARLGVESLAAAQPAPAATPVGPTTTAAAMLRDPIGTLRAAGLDELFQQEREQLKREFRQERELEHQAAQAEKVAAQAERVRNDFVDQNKAVIFQLDGEGRPAINPLNGQPILTPQGAEIFAVADQYAQEFRGTYGIEPRPQDVINHVQARLAADQVASTYGSSVAPPQVFQSTAPTVPTERSLGGLSAAGNHMRVSMATAPPAPLYGPSAASSNFTIQQTIAAAEAPPTPQQPFSPFQFQEMLLTAARQRGLNA